MILSPAYCKKHKKQDFCYIDRKFKNKTIVKTMQRNLSEMTDCQGRLRK